MQLKFIKLLDWNILNLTSNTCMYVCVCMGTYRIPCNCACVYTYMCVIMCLYCTYGCVCMCTCSYVCMYHVSVHVCVCAYIYIWVCAYMCVCMLYTIIIQRKGTTQKAKPVQGVLKHKITKHNNQDKTI